MDLRVELRKKGNTWDAAILGTPLFGVAHTIPGALRKLATSLEEEASLKVGDWLQERLRGGPKNEG